MNVVLVALYKYQNFPIRMMHSLLESIEGVTPHTIFFKDHSNNIFNPPSEKELDIFVQQIIDLNPKLVGFSVLSPYFYVAKRLTKLIKDNLSTLVIWGGIHPTISPKSSIKEADILCIGEGEGPLLDLVKLLRDKKDYQNIDNLWVNSGCQIIKNNLRPLEQDLDLLPFPSYANESFYFIDSNIIKKSDPVLLDNKLLIQTSRGCPFVCSYCVNSLLKPMSKNLGNYTRRRSVDNIIKEIKENLNLPGNKRKYIFFIDEVFGTNEKWLNEFESTYKKEIGLPFLVEYNPLSINSKVLSKLAGCGLDTINFGIQTG